MSTIAPAHASIEKPADRPTDDQWEEILVCIESQQVIPVVGADLVQVETGRGPMALARYVAEELARMGALASDSLSSEPTLNEVVCGHLKSGRNANSVYKTIPSILRNAEFKPSQALLDLAEIKHFNLYVSTTFDSLLSEALSAKRGGVESLAYRPNQVQDLRRTKSEIRHEPVVYHLLGRASTLPDYVVSDEDMLEFLCALQAHEKHLEKLFYELQNNHLLILGANFPDWLTRFFLRTVRRSRPSEDRCSKYLVDSRSVDDPNLVLFVRLFAGSDNFVFRGAAEFLAELKKRLARRQVAEHEPPRAGPANEPPPPNTIFISYAHEDKSAARKLCQKLRESGLSAWFDESEIEPGDNWRRLALAGIKKSACFLALISKTTNEVERGEFRTEWVEAEMEAKRRRPDRKFFIPVIVDDERHAKGLPPHFNHIIEQRLPKGEANEEFVELLRKVVAGEQP